MNESINIKSQTQEPDIVFSKAVLSGKRIYYLDVKKSRKGELFLNITESKKILPKDSSQPVVQFEKHKIFLYKEEFDKFLAALNETISYAKVNNNSDLVLSQERKEIVEPITLKIEF